MTRTKRQSRAELRALSIELPETHRKRTAVAVAEVEEIVNGPEGCRSGRVRCNLRPRDGWVEAFG